MIELLTFRDSLEVRESLGRAKVGGYAAVFYRKSNRETEYELQPGLYERILDGAFDETLENSDIVALYNHDRNAILGRESAGTLSIGTDRRGLRFEVELPDTQTGRDLAVSVGRGDIAGASFGFMVPDGGDRFRQDGRKVVREISAVDLKEVSAVVWPAYAGTRVSLREQANLRGLRRFQERRRALAIRSRGL